MAKKTSKKNGLDIEKAVEAISEVKSFVSSVSSLFEKKTKNDAKAEYLGLSTEMTNSKKIKEESVASSLIEDKDKGLDKTKQPDTTTKVADKTETRETEIVPKLSVLFGKKSSKEQDVVKVIDNVDSLSDYLQKLEPDASPSVMMALQSQMQVLKVVQSPTMTLMALDNILVCLYKALKNAENEEERASLREVFTSLLQSFIFVSEARFNYEIESNREESVRLLADAGDMLMSTVEATAMMVTMPAVKGAQMVAKGATMATSAKKALPVMANVLASSSVQKSFLGRLVMAKGKKAIIEEKKQEFDKTLNYIFETLDKYSELVGPSIQLHGMLKRYADGLAERFSIAQYALVEKLVNEGESGQLDSFLDSAEEVVKTRNIVGAARLLLQGVSQAVKSKTKYDYESVRNMKRALQSEMKNYENELVSLDESIGKLNTEMQELSRLQFSRRGALQQQIDEHKARKEVVDKSILELTKRITIVGDIIDPVNERVEQYAANLYRIVGKFEYTLY